MQRNLDIMIILHYHYDYPQVERCRFQLFGHENISGDPPAEPRPSWRDDCSLILHKEVNLCACTEAKVFTGQSALKCICLVKSLSKKYIIMHHFNFTLICFMVVSLKW